jgi:hypothetical protein
MRLMPLTLLGVCLPLLPQLYELLLTVGTLSAVVVDWALGDRWRVMVGVPAIPGAIMALALLVLPESPR